MTFPVITSVAVDVCVTELTERFYMLLSGTFSWLTMTGVLDAASELCFIPLVTERKVAR